MPYVEGESLREKLNREKQLGVEETLKIAEGVAAALDLLLITASSAAGVKPVRLAAT